MNEDDDVVERCRWCHERIYFELVITGQWSHGHGGTWCRDRHGFTATPLHRAQPIYHPEGGVL